MLTLVFILITTNNVNTKLECGNERVEGRVKTHCLGDRHRHIMTTVCKSITKTKVFARPLNRSSPSMKGLGHMPKTQGNTEM